MTWKAEIIKAFTMLGGEAYLKEIYSYIEKYTDRKLSPNYQATIRKTIENFSSDSANFKGEDLFRKIEKGKWGLRNN